MIRFFLLLLLIPSLAFGAFPTISPQPTIMVGAEYPIHIFVDNSSFIIKHPFGPYIKMKKGLNI